MEPLEIKHALERALGKGAQTKIARRCKRSPQMVHRVIWLSEVSDHIRREIAKEIGHGVSDIWPESKAVNQ